MKLSLISYSAHIWVLSGSLMDIEVMCRLVRGVTDLVPVVSGYL